MNRINILILAICSLLITGVIGYKNYLESNKLYFVIDIETSATGSSQIFYDTGHGHIEQDSTTLQIYRGAFQKYSFPLPTLITNIKSIRFDPINKTSVISIKEARIENAAGEALKYFPVDDFVAKQQIINMDVNENVLIMHTTENANDPVIEIENSSLDRKISLMDFLAKRGWICSGYALILSSIIIGLVKCRQRFTVIIEWLVNYSVENPKKAIAFIGFISAVASCYPVVFFGMSFSTPGPGLYGAPPWIPGYPFNVINENFRGSDTGAMAWCIAPNSVVQHDSLFHYFEFPFWNRYVGGGIPLFAQGQSMIGDVLHWIPVVMNGSAVGWDIKFFLSKAIFAVGMGLLVFRLTDKLLAGLLIAISSCFLGFFATRFNHPVFFVLTYAPWVVLQWDRLGRIAALPSPSVNNYVSQGLLLAAVTWLQFNSGAPKEGAITACFMHSLGMLAFWGHISSKWGRVQAVVFACGIGFALIMITAPHWLLFLDALGKSFTFYDNPSVQTLSLWSFVGFFDNFFDYFAVPSVNLFALFYISSAFLSLHRQHSSMVYGSWGLFTLAMATANGLIPVSVLIAIPFINKVQHVGDTLSVPMMVLALIIAGYGIRDYLLVSVKRKKTIIIYSLITYLVLWLVYALNSQDWRHTVIFFVVTFGIAIIGAVQLYRHVELSDWTRNGLIILVCSFLLIHIRHGMHLMTGVTVLDNYVINPTERPDFTNKSNAIEYIKNEINKENIPTRVVGEGSVLFPGFNIRLGLEGIVPVDAVRSKNYEKLLTLIDYPDPGWGWGWIHLIRSDQISSRSASLNLLGIGYIVSEVGTKMPSDMKLVHSSDLDVWQRQAVWPRAFFVNNIIEVHKPSDILDALADKSHTPFATVETQFIPQRAINNNVPYQVVPAGEYKLTNNSTRFSVEASGPGIIVLGETYYPGDFVATVNGENVDYIRVNEASKGIWVNKAGKYDVSFTYRPERLNQAISICLIGLALLLLIIILSAGVPGGVKRHSFIDL